MENIDICCLIGQTKLPVGLQIISLSDKSEIVIGRASDVDVKIPSDMVSRKHALLRNTSQGWTITDNESLNGICVNNRRLKPGVSQILHDSDFIQLGKSLKPGLKSPYLYQFKTNLKVKILQRHHADQGPDKDSMKVEEYCGQCGQQLIALVVSPSPVCIPNLTEDANIEVSASGDKGDSGDVTTASACR